MDTDSDLEFDYPDLQPGSETQGYMFEPPPQRELIDEPNGEENQQDENIERIGNTEW